MKKIGIIKKAIFLRKKGYSYKEIAARLKISKSTASLWLLDVKINKAGLKRLEEIGDLGRIKGINTNKKKRLIRQQVIANKTLVFSRNLSGYNAEKCKLLMALLYWGEGAKTGSRLTFINSDPNLIKFYLFLFRRSFIIDGRKLKGLIHVHNYHNQDEIIDYWSKITKINKKSLSIYKKNNSGNAIRKDYNGCISLRYGDVNVFDEIMLIINRLHKAID